MTLDKATYSKQAEFPAETGLSLLQRLFVLAMLGVIAMVVAGYFA
jgi:hypothetical protein